jgi:hypothetical protein
LVPVPIELIEQRCVLRGPFLRAHDLIAAPVGTRERRRDRGVVGLAGTAGRDCGRAATGQRRNDQNVGMPPHE